MTNFNLNYFGLVDFVLFRIYFIICGDNGDIYFLQVFAFVAPKIIGGENAPTPVGELGMVEMSQALNLIDVCYEQVSRH